MLEHRDTFIVTSSAFNFLDDLMSGGLSNIVYYLMKKAMNKARLKAE